MQKTDITINITNANYLVNKAGGKPLDPTSPTSIDKQMEKALKDALTENFGTYHPGQTLPLQNSGFGYFGPFSNARQGEVPQAVKNQILQDFTNWQIDTDTDVAEQIGKTITTNLVAQGGQAGAFSGVTADGPNASISWLCYAGLGNTEDIVYVFGAVESVDIG